MKKVRLTIVLFAALLLVSCVPSKLVYEEHMNRQSEPLMLNPYVTPTIADLEISDTKETIVASFDNNLTSNVNNNKKIEEWKNVTMTKMMKEFDSDVVVAPIFDINTSKDLRTITVELSGYPAKYTNFRNVQLADSASMRVYNVEIARPITMGYGVNNNVSINALKQINETFVRGGKNFFMPEIGFNIGALGGDDFILDLQAIYGYEMNNYLSVGVGLGIVTCKDDEYYYQGYHNYDKERIVSVPLLVNLNGFLLKNKVSPYYSIDLGYMLPIIKAHDEIKHTLDYEVLARSYMKGIAFSPEIGMAFGDFRIGAEWKMLKSYEDKKVKYKESMSEYYMQEIESEFNVEDVREYKENSLFLKVGYRF